MIGIMKGSATPLLCGLAMVAFDLAGCSQGSVGGDAAAGSDARDTPGGVLLCSQLLEAAQAQFQARLQSTAWLECSADSDCTVYRIQSVRCFAPCGVPLPESATSAAYVASEGVCTPFYAAVCGSTRTLTLCPTSRPACDRGTCVSVFLPNPTDAAVDVDTPDVPPAVDTQAAFEAPSDTPSADQDAGTAPEAAVDSGGGAERDVGAG